MEIDERPSTPSRPAATHLLGALSLFAVVGIAAAMLAPASKGGRPLAHAVRLIVAQSDGAGPSGAIASPPAGGIVSVAATPTGNGWWATASDGSVYNFGDATYYGSMSGASLNQPIVGISGTPSGLGYWLVARDGGIFSFGDAAFHGSTGAIHLNQPIVGMSSTPSGSGYHLVAADGGIFAFGDAAFRGSTGGIRLNQPIVGMAATPSGLGYWMVAADGGIFNFGDAPFVGSAGGMALPAPVTTMAPSGSGQGYYIIVGSGQVLAFGDAAPVAGGEGTLSGAVVGAASYRGGRGVRLIARDGNSLGLRAGVPSAPTGPSAPPAIVGPPVVAELPAVPPAPVVAAPHPSPTPATSPGVGPGEGRPFTAASPLNVPVSPSVLPRSDSASLVSLLTATHKMYANLDEFGIPIYTATATTPRYNVTCTAPWGTCGLSKQPVPIPDDAIPAPGSDGAMVVIDPTTHRSFEFWQASKTAGNWSVSWGSVVALDSDGTHSSGTGSGISRLAGVVRASEIAAGVIDHALVFSSNLTCRATFVSPATKTDGSRDQACIPEGSHIQLDPSIDVDRLPGITAGERAIGHALQTYGAFCVDSGGASMAFSFERVTGSAPYVQAGLAWDYFNMVHLPQAFRVLQG